MDIALFSPISRAGTLVLLAGMVAFGLAAIWLVRRRHAHGGGVGRAMLLAVGGTFMVAAGVSLVEDAALDLNPVFRAADLEGTWRFGPATLMLAPDNTYRCMPRAACDGLGAGGGWERSADFEILFRPAAGAPVVERVVTFRGEHRLTRLESIDTWTRELTFRHIAPAG